MKRLILIIIIIFLLIFYISIFIIKEKRVTEMCESFKKSAGVEDCTLEYYKNRTSDDFEKKYLESQ